MSALVWLAACGHQAPPESAVQVFRPGPPEPSEAGPLAPALEAAPAAPLPARIGVYAQNADLEQRVAKSLEGLQGVESTWALPGYLVDGRTRVHPVYGYPARPPGPVDLDQLRSLAAMAHCDLLLVVDRGYAETSRANGWVALAPLLLPLLFTPFLSVDDHSSLDATLIDVRTGYLYGSLSADTTTRRGPITMYALERPSVVDAQLDALLDQSRDPLSDLLWYHLLDR